MSKRIKHISLILVIQAACVFVGLWMEYQFARMAARQAIAERAQDAMGAVIDDVFPGVESILASGALESEQTVRRVGGFLKQAELAEYSVILADAEWRPLTWVNSPSDGDGEFQPKTALRWVASSERDERAFATRPGAFQLNGQEHIAVARHCGGTTAYLIVHRSTDGIEPALTSFIATIPALHGMTFLWTCSLLSIVVYLVSGRFYDEIEGEQKRVAADAVMQTQSLLRTRDAVIFGLAKLADSRDPETGDHLERISTYSTSLAGALRRNPRFRDEATPLFVRTIGISSALHDIGKVGIEDAILRKAAGLTDAERRKMELHTSIGGDCLRDIEQRLGSSNFLQMARVIALAHHERWDGAGYPERLAEHEIPLAARIVAIADVYDALSCKRVYKPALPHSECVAIICSQSGKHFDPDLVEVWLTIEDRFREIALQYGVGLDAVSSGIPVQGGGVEESVDAPAGSGHREFEAVLADRL